MFVVRTPECPDCAPLVKLGCPMEPPFLSFWNILDSLVYSEDSPSWVEWRVCGKKTQEGLANGAFMYFLVSLEGEK